MIKDSYPPQSLNSTAWIVGLASSDIDTSLTSWTVIKGRYRAEPWIVLHGWPIEPMARWIQWVTSLWNIGTDWSPIVIICRWFLWFRLSHNRPRWWVLPMYRSSSILPQNLQKQGANPAYIQTPISPATCNSPSRTWGGGLFWNPNWRGLHGIPTLKMHTAVLNKSTQFI